MMDSQIVLVIVFFIFQFLCSSAVVDSKSIALSLSRHKHYSSSARAQSFKQSKLTTRDLPSAVDEHDIPLFPRGYGGYSLKLSFGTPPQTLPFDMDTTSSLTWFPCTYDFSCDDCNVTGMFIPEISTSSQKVSCNSTQCKWFFSDHKCTSQELYCPDYDFSFGSAATTGWLLSEFITFPDETRLDNFIVGCSDYALEASLGTVGFGRARYSLPSQMELDSFSYCMLSHDFDDNITISSDLVLTKGGNDSAPTAGGIVQYTPFIHNPNSSPDYYYVRLQNITVGDVNITVPDEYQIPSVDGEGGTIVDSGNTFLYLELSLFYLVTDEFKWQVIEKNNSNSRNSTTESMNGLPVCFDVMSFDDIPTLSLHFQGGAVMDLPMHNYILDVGYKNGVCLMMLASPSEGPTIFLGNSLQQNFYLEFDLKNNRLGFLKHTCTAK